MERCNITSYAYDDNDFEVQDVVISCSTEDCKTLSQSHELLIDVILENYEFTKIIVILSTQHEEWIESFRVNYTEIDEDESLEEEIDAAEKQVNEIMDSVFGQDSKPNRFRTPRKLQTKQKINLILISVAQHFYSLLTNLLKILYDL